MSKLDKSIVQQCFPSASFVILLDIEFACWRLVQARRTILNSNLESLIRLHTSISKASVSIRICLGLFDWFESYSCFLEKSIKVVSLVPRNGIYSSLSSVSLQFS